jgi:predicted outer membrane repeat protein
MDHNDNYCSLAEAIESVNEGEPIGCQDAFPGSSAIIQFQEASGLPFAQNPFVIESLTITGDVMLFGSGAHINSTGTSGLVIWINASVELHGLTLTFTGTTGHGRLIQNFGDLAIFGSILKNGDVTALSGSDAYGGALYNASIGVITDVGVDVSFISNKAQRGGAIYNNKGRIDNLSGLIQGNIATMAGGGIYNLSDAINGASPSNGIIYAVLPTITKNSAKAGGGVFNRGYFDMTGGSITLNSVGSGASGETCSWSPAQSCDGKGGGVVSGPASSTLSAGFNTRGGVTISANTAVGLGGAIYTAGQANLVGVTMASNQALRGAAIYAVPQGAAFYCQIGASGGESATINNNTATGGYSILAGLALQPDTDNDQCIFTETSASGNSPFGNPPAFCNASMVREGSQCPQQ